MKDIDMQRRAFTYIIQAVLCVALLSLTGCGTKGPLYLPEKPTQTQATQP